MRLLVRNGTLSHTKRATHITPLPQTLREGKCRCAQQHRFRPVAVYRCFLHRPVRTEYRFVAGENLPREGVLPAADAVFPLNHRHLRGVDSAFAGEAVAQVFAHFLREEAGAVKVLDGGGEEV